MRRAIGAQERVRDTKEISRACRTVRANIAPLSGKGNISGLPDQSACSSGTGPPDPEKRSPAPTDIGHGANRERKNKPRKNIKSGRAQQEINHVSLAVTCGRETIGIVKQEGRKFSAFTADHRRLGTYASVAMAANAISDAHGDCHA
jgi:hypothetical protein